MVVQQRRCTTHVPAGIGEKWWRQHISDVDDGATRAPGLEFRGENLGLTHVARPGNDDVVMSLPC
jgi:hypothetical protein